MKVELIRDYAVWHRDSVIAEVDGDFEFDRLGEHYTEIYTNAVASPGEPFEVELEDGTVTVRARVWSEGKYVGEVESHDDVVEVEHA